jgi:hypothetical protein
MKRISLEIPGAAINLYAGADDPERPTGVLAIQIMPLTPHMETVLRKGIQAGKGIVLAIPGDVAVKMLMPAITACCAEIVGIEIPEPEAEPKIIMEPS